MSKPVLAGLRILVLEDEFLIAMEIEQICRDHGCTDVLLRQGPQEVEDALLDQVDLAILDVMAHDGTTLELARRLRGRPLPFVFSTGLSAGEDVFRLFPEVPVATKPYGAETLIGALVQALAKPEASPAPDQTEAPDPITCEDIASGP